MGFNVTALAQKARTQTLIVDSDLNMGNYDLIATDVKGDTAEFSEFVGGVGNFESGLISGGLDVGDILHAESSMQIDGDLVVEGAINNVNITNEGAISTAKSVTATGGFKGNVTGNVTGSISGGTVAGSTGTFSGAVTGAKFKPSALTVVTVAPSTNFIKIGTYSQSEDLFNTFCVLPLNPLFVYSGSLVLGEASTSSNREIGIGIINENNTTTITKYNTASQTITFSRIKSLWAYQTTGYTNRDLISVPILSIS